MNTLLVAYDGSENSQRALRHAIAMAKSHGEYALHVVHAHEIPLVYGEIGMYISDEKMAELQRQHSEQILQGAQMILKDSGVPYTTEVLIGHIADQIARRADELGSKGILVGTRGMGAVGNLVMGSIATKIIHLAKVPVTLVK